MPMPAAPDPLPNDEDIARAWIAFHMPREDDGHRSPYWMSKHIRNLIRHTPEQAWQLILLIWAMDQSPAIMESLSAGPVEDLLGWHGDRMIGLVEAEAARDPSFARMLGGVWQNRMSNEVWERLQKVCDRRGWDGITEE